MDQKEVKQIFQKFYRTKKAEESGEAGTGIGLVDRAADRGAARRPIDVISEPGAVPALRLVLAGRSQHGWNPVDA